jgi:hypothetical protein
MGMFKSALHVSLSDHKSVDAPTTAGGTRFVVVGTASADLMLPYLLAVFCRDCINFGGKITSLSLSGS